MAKKGELYSIENPLVYEPDSYILNNKKQAEIKYKGIEDKKNIFTDYNNVKNNKMTEYDFRNKYGTSTHMYRYNNDKEYRDIFEENAAINSRENGSINYPNSDLRSKNFTGSPNLAFMNPTGMKGKQLAETEQFNMGIIGAALPIPFVDDAAKISFSGIKKVSKPISDLLNKKIQLKNNYLTNFDKDSYYRVIGNSDGYNDLLSSGFVRPNQSGIFKDRNTYYTKGKVNDINNPVVGGGVKKNTIYEGNYIVEVKPNDVHFPTSDHKLSKDWDFGLTTNGNEIPYSSEYLNIYKFNNKAKKYEIINKTNTPKSIKLTDFNNQDEFYRIIVGDEAFDDIIKSNKIRTNYYNKNRAKGIDVIDLSNRGTLFPSFSKGNPSIEYAKSNPNHYIIKTSDASIKPSTAGRHGKGTTMFPTDNAGKHLPELDASKVQVYKHIGNDSYELVFPKTIK